MTPNSVKRIVAGGLIALAVLLLALTPTLLRAAGLSDYWLELVVWIMFFAYCAVAWNIVGGFAGQYSFGHAAFLGLGAYTSTILNLYGGVTPWLGMFAGAAVAAGAAALIAYPTFRLRGVFFSLATIAFAEMLRIGLELTDDLFGFPIHGVSGLAIPPRNGAAAMFQFDDKQFYAYTILAMLLVAIAVAASVKRSRLGYYLAAIGDDEEAVASLGINPARVKLIALLVSAALTAMAGTFYAQFVLFITPTRTIDLDLSVQMVIMSVFGGLGTVMGPVYGAMVLVPIAETIRAVWGGSLQGVHLIIYGALLIIAVLYVARGIEVYVTAGFRCLVDGIAGLFRRTAATSAAVPNRPIIELPRGERLFPASGDNPGLLRLQDVTRRFGGAIGVSNFSMTVRPGEIVGLIGPNGAGKTTVFNLITGLLAPQSGRIVFGDTDLTSLSPAEINRLGIARTFQIVRPFTRLSTIENVMVAALPRQDSHAAARIEAARCLSFVGLAHRAEAPADGLSTGERKRLELARALATRPRILLLDEVSGGLDQRSVPGLIALIRKVREEGISVLVIEHNLRIIGDVADRLVMLNLGERVKEGEPKTVLADPLVVDIYVGALGAVG